MPKVSVILPTHNGAKWIERAIKSVQIQSFTDFELLVIDDGSSDSTAGIVQRLAKEDKRIVYLKNNLNAGIQKSLNRGLKEAKGVFIARIDDDDVWIDKEKLGKQVEFLQENPGYVLVGTGVIVVNDKDEEIMRYILPGTDAEIRSRILSKNCFAHSSVMFRKDAAMKFGGYFESKEALHVEDYDLWLKLGTIGKFANLQTYAIKYLFRDQGISQINKLKTVINSFRVSRKYFRYYPNSLPSFIYGFIKIIFAILFCLFPAKRAKIIEIYKKF